MSNTNNPAGWLPGLVGPVNLSDAQKSGQKFVIRWDANTGAYAAELPVEAPDGVLNALIGVDGNGGIKNVQPAGLVAGDMFYWDGTLWKKVAGAPDGTSTYSLKRVAGVPTWVADAPAFDLASVAWSSWFEGAGYNASTGNIAGKASAGASAAKVFNALGTTLPVAGIINAKQTIKLASSASQYVRYSGGAGHEVEDLLSVTGWTICAIIKITSVPTDSTNPYGNPSLGGSTDANVAVGVRSSGIIEAYQSATANGTGSISNRIATKPWTASTLMMVQAKFDGTNIQLRTSKGAFAMQTSGNPSSIVGTFRIGSSYNGAPYGDIEICEYMTALSPIATSILDSAADALSAKWGVVV